MKQDNQIPRMLSEPFSPATRRPKTLRIDSDLVIVGGGLAGTCAAITAARAGIKVALVQDRPVLGGNASSEVRLWALGATSHMNNNNRWSREGGVIDEILVENMYRNKEGNALIFDTVLLEKVVSEDNITLLLNTAAVSVQKSDGETIESVTAFCSQNSTQYELHAPLFCDASGDGIVAFQAGAAFRMGAESTEEFGEKFAPTEEYGYLLGHSIYFYTKDIGEPVKFVPPSYALDDITEIPALPQFQHGDRWLPPVVDRIRRPPGHGARNRDHQVAALESGLRRLELHQEFGRIPRCRNAHPGMGRADPRQAREPAL